MTNTPLSTNNDMVTGPIPDGQLHDDTSNQTYQPSDSTSSINNAAINLIREKLRTIYAEEPNATQELAEAEAPRHSHSKHQQYIETLQRSGKNIAEIQTAWHNYYVSIPDTEKFEVWQEFYTSNHVVHHNRLAPHAQPPMPKPVQPQLSAPPQAPVSPNQQPKPIKSKRTLADTRKALLGTIQSQTKLKPHEHLKSLAFGLICGVVVVVIFLFSFFNEVIIAPFIQPSRHVSSIPLIITSGTIVTSTPQVIIPKINVEIPVDYSETSTNENAIENDLEGGIVHYPNTVLPGQNGNAAFFGHSSNNIFNPGKYKFAFVLLHTLVSGDTFYLTYNNTVYAYQVVDHRVVSPSDVSVLNDTLGHQATATLITCDPPGTSINRLVVTGEQINPNPSSNSALPSSPQISAEPSTLPGNGPSLWSRFTHWLL
jgi:sortase A